MPPSRFPAAAQIRYYLLVILILWAALWLRSANLLGMPLFLDEGIHIQWSRAVQAGQPYTGVIDNKWLYPVVLAPFALLGPESPWLARAVSALLGTLITAGCIALSRQLGDRSLGILSGLIYAALPFAVFHERQALVDPLMAAFSIVATVSMVRLAIRSDRLAAILLILSVAGAFLTKIAALPYLGLSFVAILLLGRRRRTAGLIWSLLAAGAAGGALGLVQSLAARRGVTPLALTQMTVENTLLGNPSGALARLISDLGVYGEIMALYAGWGVLALAAVAGAAALWGYRRRVIAFLLIPAFGFALVPLLAMRPAALLAPRYLLAAAAPLAVLAALGLQAVRRLSENRLRGWSAGALALVLGPALWMDFQILWSPLEVHLPNPDEQQYQTGWSSGRGRVEMARALLAEWDPGSSQRLDVLYVGDGVQTLQAYLGPRVGDFATLENSPGQWNGAAEWLADGHRVFVMQVSHDAALPADLYGARLELIGSFPGALGLLRLYELSGAEGPLAAAVYAQLGPEPALIGSDYEALGGSGWAPGEPVLIFPPGHADALRAAAGVEVQRIQPAGWPLGAAEAEAALRGLTLSEDGAPLSVVIAYETETDPHRAVLLALDRRLYYLEERWFGALNRRQYVSGPSEPDMQPLGVQFEGGIELVSAALVDPVSQPGGAVRIVMAWQTPIPIGDPYSIFVHVADSAGTLAAQHDGAPGGGLFPLMLWQPGQIVADRLAIRLPPDIPPGEYEIRAGIYHPASGLRLLAASDSGAANDHVVIGRLVVETAE